MRFSKKSQYALRALIELTQSYGHAPLRRKEIAQRQQIPVGFLESILLQLKHAGILDSRTGIAGGFRLIKSPQDVSLGSIIRTLDGPLAPIACISQTAYQKCQDCPYADHKQCPIKTVMLEVRNAIVAILDHYTLKDFFQNVSSFQCNHEKPKKPEKARGRIRS
ncbi:MAG: Rrf2 family transcriptional regulator [Nitrospirales bacterium]|nr:Rrf2 family transcriptional regulator [Nitrospirales bacterium]